MRKVFLDRAKVNLFSVTTYWHLQLKHLLKTTSGEVKDVSKTVFGKKQVRFIGDLFDFVQYIKRTRFFTKYGFIFHLWHWRDWLCELEKDTLPFLGVYIVCFTPDNHTYQSISRSTNWVQCSLQCDSNSLIFRTEIKYFTYLTDSTGEVLMCVSSMSGFKKTIYKF